MWHHFRARIDNIRFGLRVLHPNIQEHQTVDILRGLPEGSHLSATLFGIFFADLSINSKLNSPTLFLHLVYSRVPGDRNWHIETADWNLAGFFTIFRNLLAGIWGGFLRFIETGFRNWLAAFLGFFYAFSMMSMIFL